MTYNRLTAVILSMHCLLPDRHTGEDDLQDVENIARGQEVRSDQHDEYPKIIVTFGN